MMRPKNRGFRMVAGCVCMVVAAVSSLVIRFMNPDMTEIRLLIEFWPLWILVCATVVMGYLWIKSAK